MIASSSSDDESVASSESSSTSSSTSADIPSPRRFACFYCTRAPFNMTTKFVLCDTCNGFSACLPCWRSQGNARGWSINFLEAQKAELIRLDQDRQIKYWPLLQQHHFTMAHANSDSDTPDFSVWTRKQFEQEDSLSEAEEEESKPTAVAQTCKPLN